MHGAAKLRAECRRRAWRMQPIMKGATMSYLGAFLLFTWGVAHLVPTRSVVRGFGDISADNRRIVIMEWLTEGIALVFIAVLVALVTYLDRTSSVSHAVYWTSFGILNLLSVVSLCTGFRNSFIAFKLCPFVFTGSSILILIGGFQG